jgi:hypothetical protein
VIRICICISGITGVTGISVIGRGDVDLPKRVSPKGDRPVVGRLPAEDTGWADGVPEVGDMCYMDMDCPQEPHYKVATLPYGDPEPKSSVDAKPLKARPGPMSFKR